MRKSRIAFESDFRRLLESEESLDHKLSRYTVLLSEYLDGSVVSLYLFEADAGLLFLKSTSRIQAPGGGAIRFSADGTISSLALCEKRMIALRETGRPAGSSLEASYYVYPMFEEDNMLAVVTIHHVAPSGLGRIQLDTARRTVARLSEIVGRAKKEAEVSRRMTKISAINEAGVTLLSHKELPDLLKTVTAVASLIMGAGSCIVRTYSESAGTFVPGDCYGLSDSRRRQRALKLDSLALQMVIDRGRAVLLRNLGREKEFETFVDTAHTLICAPLMSGEDMIGSITILNKNAGDAFTAPYFTGDDETNFIRLSKYVEKSVAEAMGHMKRKELCQHDEISGLPDNHYFESRLSAEINRASRFESRLVILVCETSLRQRGEGLHYRSRYSRLIKCAAAAITKTLREYDVVASLGDGRFGMILPQSEDGSVSAVARVKMSVEEALREYGEVLPEEKPTLSFAEAHYPDDGRDGSSLMAALQQA